MLSKEAFYITSFQESKGYKGVKGLDRKVCFSTLMSQKKNPSTLMIWDGNHNQ